ncbi:unnamed protein product [Chrysoparadoxa australica]
MNYTRHREAPQLQGLPNLGNTCYINAVLQSLFGLETFAKDLMSNRWVQAALQAAKTQSLLETVDHRVSNNQGKENSPPILGHTGGKLKAKGKDASKVPALYLAMLRVLLVSKNMAHGIMSPAQLKRAMDAQSDKFAGNMQQDAHEFCSDLLNAVHDELLLLVDSLPANTMRLTEAVGSTKARTTGTLADAMVTPGETGPVPTESSATPSNGAKTDIQAAANQPSSDCRTKDESRLCWLPTTQSFHAEVEVTLVCNDCGYMRSKVELYRDFSLDLPTEVKLIMSMAELLEGFFQAKQLSLDCERCMCKSVTATYAFGALPGVLMLHIKRFKYNPVGMCYSKLVTPITLPLELDLEKFCTDHTANHEGLDLSPTWNGMVVGNSNALHGNDSRFTPPKGKRKGDDSKKEDAKRQQPIVISESSEAKRATECASPAFCTPAKSPKQHKVRSRGAQVQGQVVMHERRKVDRWSQDGGKSLAEGITYGSRRGGTRARPVMKGCVNYKRAVTSDCQGANVRAALQAHNEGSSSSGEERQLGEALKACKEWEEKKWDEDDFAIAMKHSMMASSAQGAADAMIQSRCQEKASQAGTTPWKESVEELEKRELKEAMALSLADQGGEWTCCKCTFLNLGLSAGCQACGTPQAASVEESSSANYHQGCGELGSTGQHGGEAEQERGEEEQISPKGVDQNQAVHVMNKAHCDNASKVRPARVGPLRSRYRLQSVLHHLGGHAFAGHYISDVKDWKKSGAGWKRFDDSLVREITQADALGGSAKKSCYIAFYALEPR